MNGSDCRPDRAISFNCRRVRTAVVGAGALRHSGFCSLDNFDNHRSRTGRTSFCGLWSSRDRNHSVGLGSEPRSIQFRCRRTYRALRSEWFSNCDDAYWTYVRDRRCFICVDEQRRCVGALDAGRWGGCKAGRSKSSAYFDAFVFCDDPRRYGDPDRDASQYRCCNLS